MNLFVVRLLVVIIAIETLYIIGQTYGKIRRDKYLNDKTYMVQRTQNVMDWLAAGVRVYVNMNKNFPSDEEDLRINLEKGGVVFGDEKGTFMFPQFDAWENLILYKKNDVQASLVSAGFDRRYGTSDDLVKVITFSQGINKNEWGFEEESILGASLDHRNKTGK